MIEMTEDEIKNSIVRYLSNSANTSDLDLLNDWVKDEKNYLLFKDYIKTHFAITIGMHEPDSKELRKRLLKEIRNDKKNTLRKKVKTILRYAAIIFLLIGLGHFYLKTINESNDEEILAQEDNQITLKLDNGEKIVLSDVGKAKISNSIGEIIGKKDGDKLVYKGVSEEKKLVYNTVKVPYGKRFDIVLSDGTKVYLNSGSSIRYPVTFINGFERRVFLDGEAFFDVIHDQKHSFVVTAEELTVQVHGTKFNLSNYAEDFDTEVVLTSGSVELFNSSSGEEAVKTLLKPGFKGAFDRTHKTISTKKVNTTLYTSWMDGNMVFRNTPFDNIIKRLERKYNVVIINNNKQLSKETFNATFETEKETIIQVFEYFSKVYNIDYQIVNNKIIIN
ncbi:FecR family protein [Maribacter sp. 2210JD10-5]|uniref:FecR family protein n=1 Tax=Maribacter sp. 2210JD10-5 TaxID=3386272 RepID=UPI0039BD8EE0